MHEGQQFERQRERELLITDYWLSSAFPFFTFSILHFTFPQ